MSYANSGCMVSLRDVWAAIKPLVRQYALRRCGQLPVKMTLTLLNGDRLTLLVGEGDIDADLQLRPAPAGEAWATGAEPKHLSDFQRVYWPGLGSYTFSRMQARVVEVLWEARESGGNPDVGQEALLRAAGSESVRLSELFRRSPAWGVLVIQGDAPGSYRLPEVEEEGQQEGD